MDIAALALRDHSLILRPLLALAVLTLLACSLVIPAVASEDPALEGIGGEGLGLVSGFVVTDVHFTLSAEHPGHAQAVSMSVLGADGVTRPAQVLVLLQVGEHATACAPQGYTRWTCPVHTPLADAGFLRVTASG